MKTTQVTFAPGCFDTFDGSQEELDALVAEIESWAAGDSVNFEVIEMGSLDQIDPDVAEYYQHLADHTRAAVH
jgi:hypothetical protein